MTENNLSPEQADRILDEALRLLHSGHSKWTDWGEDSTDIEETVMLRLVHLGLFEARQKTFIESEAGALLYSCRLRVQGAWGGDSLRDAVAERLPLAMLGDGKTRRGMAIRSEPYHQVRLTSAGERAVAATPLAVRQWIRQANTTGAKPLLIVDQWQTHWIEDDAVAPAAPATVTTKETEPATATEKPRKPPGRALLRTYYAYSAAEAYLIEHHNEPSPTQIAVYEILKNTNCDIPDVPEGFKLQDKFSGFTKAYKRARTALGHD